MKDLIASIVSVADELDRMGLKEYADVMDDIMIKMAKKKEKSKKKEKWIPKKMDEGSFTEYCGGKPSAECAHKALKSKDPSIRGKGSFYLNVAKKQKKKKK